MNVEAGATATRHPRPRPPGTPPLDDVVTEPSLHSNRYLFNLGNGGRWLLPLNQQSDERI